MPPSKVLESNNDRLIDQREYNIAFYALLNMEDVYADSDIFDTDCGGYINGPLIKETVLGNAFLCGMLDLKTR